MSNRKVLHTLIALGLILTSSATVLADPISDLLREKEVQEQNLRQQTNSLESAEDKVDKLENQIQMLDSQIEKMMREIEENKKAIAQKEKDIVKAQEEVDKAQKDIDEQQQLLDARVRAMYKSGNKGYINILLQSDSIGDLVSRIESVNKIIEYDKEVINELENRKKILDEKKKALQEENDKLIALKKENEKKLADMTASKNKQVALITEAKKERDALASKVTASRNAIAAAERKIQELRAAADRYDPSRGVSSFSTDKVVVFASNFLGTPYVWGGTTPNPGFDCSGFVKYVYAHFGITLNRTTYDQIKQGTSVSKDQLQPGDLVFFGSWADPHHVGIYVGNDCYIHAPQTGDVVKISPMTRKDFVIGKRIR